MAPLLRWGLPSRASDATLFAGGQPWEAARYGVVKALVERQIRPEGADTDLNPLPRRDAVVSLTTDESARAEILRRYRLFTRQPDEMLTFMALQRMRPRDRDFDPGLYQYGGGFIYLIGGVMVLSSALGITRLSSDASLYLECPELFARFYVVARVVTLVFGGLLLVAVWKLARRAAGRTAAWVAFVLVAGCPVFITSVLEAKPHIPSVCLILWATLSAVDYGARPRCRHAVRLGFQAGCACGLVLSGIVVAALWPALVYVRRSLKPAQHLLVGMALAAGVYVLTNPYVPYNYVRGRAALASNLSNSLAMYAGQARRAPQGAVRVCELLVESCGPTVVVGGLIGLALLVRRHGRAAMLAASAGLTMLVISALLGAGKPAEYARFLLLPASLLCVSAAGLVAELARRRRILGLAVALACALTMRTAAYVRAFMADAAGEFETRHVAADYLVSRAGPTDSVAVIQEPAPYAVPPIDFARREILWLPADKPGAPDGEALPTWLVFTADDDTVHRDAWWRSSYRLEACFPPVGTPLARISWANKPVFVFRRGTLLDTRLDANENHGPP